MESEASGEGSEYFRQRKPRPPLFLNSSLYQNFEIGMNSINLMLASYQAATITPELRDILNICMHILLNFVHFFLFFYE